MATQISPEFTGHQRRLANYPLSVWDDGYIQSLRIDSMEKEVASRVRMVDEVRYLLCKEKDLVVQLELIDTLQQLGVAYHFEKDIKDVLTTIYESIDTISVVTREDLYAISLLFRVIREHGSHISPDIFTSFNDEKGCFKVYLQNDIKGMLSLYEASFLATEGENQMDEARNLATKSLRDFTAGLLVESSLKQQVNHALEVPLRWRMQRLHTRWFIDHYERSKHDRNPLLIKLAKVDFNIVQGIYKRELKELSRWWMDLDLGESLGFARERFVENYFATVGLAFEPKFSRSREAITKVHCLITAIDDVYDVYGSLDELELFTDAVDRWDANQIEQLPDYMKVCFMALFNTTNDTAYKTLKLKRVDILPCLKRAWADLCKSYLVEAKWYHGGYMPSMKEYLDNAWVSISGHVIQAHAYCTSDDMTKEALECFNVYPDVVYHSSMIFRLWNDLATSTAELERGDVPKSIQCFMHENKVSEATAREYIKEMIASSWKKLNGAHNANSTFPESFKKVALNFPRMAQCMYQDGDGYGESGRETKDQIISLLIQPIPL